MPLRPPPEKSKPVAGTFFVAWSVRDSVRPMPGPCRHPRLDNGRPCGHRLHYTRGPWTLKARCNVCGCNTRAAYRLPTVTHDYLRLVNDSAELQALELGRCMRSPWYWIVNYVVTRDEHDDETPAKRFPPIHYLQAASDTWHHERLSAWPKSRQMLMSWWAVALYLGWAMYAPARLIVFQSQGADEVQYLLERAKVIWRGLQPWVQRAAEWTSEWVRFDNGSRILAVPGGPEQFESKTLSGYLGDEMKLHERAEQEYEQVQACVRGTGRMTLISANDRSWWYDTFLADKIGA